MVCNCGLNQCRRRDLDYGHHWPYPGHIGGHQESGLRRPPTVTLELLALSRAVFAVTPAVTVIPALIGRRAMGTSWSALLNWLGSEAVVCAPPDRTGGSTLLTVKRSQGNDDNQDLDNQPTH